MGIRHKTVHRSHATSQYRELEDAQNHTQAVRQHRHPAFGRGQQIRADCQAHRQQQRPQCQQRPIDNDAPRQVPRGAHAPNLVELAVNRQNQHQRRYQKRCCADPADFAGFRGKLPQITEHLASNVVRYQAVHQQLLQAVLHLRKHRKNAEYRQRHSEQRHDGDDGGEGQTAGRQTQMVFIKALTQRQSRVFPRESERIAHKIPQTNFEPYFQFIHAAIMPLETPHVRRFLSPFL